MRVHSKLLLTINKYTAFACGITSTMPIVTVPGTNTTVSMFTALCIVFLVVNMIFFNNTFYFKVGSNTKKLLLWMAAAFVSCLAGLIYYVNNETWRLAVQGYIPKIIVFVLFCLFIYKNDFLVEPLLKGLLIGAVANVVAAIVDAIIYYLLGYSIINQLFENYIRVHQIRYDSVSLVFNGVLRSGGFNYDPAHIGMLAPFVFVYGLCVHKYFYILLALGALISSQSTTGLVSCVLCCILFYAVLGERKTVHFRFTGKQLLLHLVWIVVACYLLQRYGAGLIIGVENFFTRINTAHIQAGSRNIRLLYILNTPQAMIEQGFKMLTGTGFMTASEGFIKMGSNFGFVLTDFPYDMENTYIAYLFDLGFYGFFLYANYLYLTAKRTIVQFKAYADNVILPVAIAGIFSTIFSGFFYHYTLFACQILIFISVSVMLDKGFKKIKSRENTI